MPAVNRKPRCNDSWRAANESKVRLSPVFYGSRPTIVPFRFARSRGLAAPGSPPSVTDLLASRVSGSKMIACRGPDGAAFFV